MSLQRNIALKVLSLMLLPLCLGAWAAPPPAGTPINNTAAAAFKDSSTGIISQLSSNTISSQVDVLESGLLTSNQSIPTSLGSAFVALHTLTNTGNSAATFSIALSPVGSGFALQNLVAYWDVNNNGKIDQGDQQVTANFTVTLPAGQAASFIITGIVPAGASLGASTQVSLSAVSADQTVQLSNTDTIQAAAGSGAGPTLQLTKTADTGSPQPGAAVNFTISMVNIGAGTATGTAITVDGTAQNSVVIRDQIPANTVFSTATLNGGGQTLYHQFGDPLQTYHSAPPSDLTTVDAVAFAFPGLSAGQQFTVSFRVMVVPNASGNILNVAIGYGQNGTTPIQTQSNALQLPLPSSAPTLGFYTSSAYTRPATVWSVGMPLYVQANAPQCNTNPLLVETHPVTISATLSGDVETFTATETGPNTGIFQITPYPLTRDAASNPVVRGNGILEVSKGDTLTAVLQGCGTTSVQSALLIDPSGIVFDSRSNVPVPGATVSLIDVTGNGNGGNAGGPAKVLLADAVTPAPSSVVTLVDGRYQFPLVAPSTYKVVVAPPAGFTYPSTLAIAQLPSSRFIDFNGSYSKNVTITGLGGAVYFDQPVDRSTTGILLVEKSSSNATAALGDFLDYVIQVKNTAAIALTNVTVRDVLPRGFAYQSNTTRIGSTVQPEPQGGHGPNLVFTIGTIAATTEVDISYRVRIGTETNIGNSTNFATATDGVTTSNTASATVNVQGGVFSPQGFVIGKVFMDCNGNRKQDPGELGIPGVRVLLEDQTYAITDSEGKYSIYGVSPYSHVAKLDAETLPAGYQAEVLSNRNAGDPMSMFVDLKNGEMFKADFATRCSEKLQEAVAERRKNSVRKGGETDAILATSFTYDTIMPAADAIKAAPSSGIIGTAPAAGSANNSNALKPSETSAAAGSNAATDASPSKPDPAKAGAAASEPLETVIANLDGKLGFINLQDGSVVAYTQSTIRVKGPSGSVFHLFVNDQQVSEKKIGKKVSNPDKNVDAWEFVAVELNPGLNHLRLLLFDQFGNERGRNEIAVTAPKGLHKIQIEVPKDAVADGKTPVMVSVRLFDIDGVPVTVPTEITLETTEGEWLVKDADPKQPGIQTFVEGGYAQFGIKPPAAPVAGKLRISNGSAQAESPIDFLPYLRPMIAAGVVDEVISFSNFSRNAVTPAQANDGFEQELQYLSIANANGSAGLQSHVGVSLKGKVAGSYLLTLAYDSDKSNTQLFRDIQPDQFYPVYGDSSVRGFDAQSTSRAYLRVDKGKSYILYGDFTTQEANPARVLSVYNRSVTGAREHYQNDTVNFTAFASHDSSTQQLQEIPANGTSGPYMLNTSNAEVNSAIVEILVRDRNQPAVILKDTPMAQFSDYELESFTGEILFKAPVPSFDQNLNPMSIRVTYELDSGGPRHWLTGFDGTVKVNDMLRVGGVYVSDMDPGQAFRMTGVNSTVKFDPHTSLTGEFVTTHMDSVGNGDGYHFEFLRDSEDLKARIYFGRTTSTFDNINSLLNQGRGEGGLKLSWKVDSTTRLVADAIRTEDTLTGGTQVGALVGVERTLPHKALFELGVRHIEQGSEPASTSTTGSVDTEFTSIRTKLTAGLPEIPKLRAYGEYEQDVTDFDKKILAVGGTYQLFDRSKFYLRHELMSSLGNDLALNSQQAQAVTVFGIDADYMKNAHVFSEYRGEDAFTGRETEAAIGLRNVWPIAPGLKLNTGVESVQALQGSGATNALALTSALEYTANPIWKGTARTEWRGTSNTQGWLSTLGAAVKINRDWTFLGRNVFSVTDSTSGPVNDQLRDRAQAGVAYRDTSTSVWNLLAMVEFRNEDDNAAGVLTNQQYAIFSTNVNYQPKQAMTFSARCATKLTIDDSGGLNSSAGDYLVSGRFTYDVAPKWDAGLQLMTDFSNGFSSRQYGVGPEIGRLMAKNMWFSVGYNVLGFHDTALSGEDSTQRGPYIRFRYKFDESLFARGGK